MDRSSNNDVIVSQPHSQQDERTTALKPGPPVHPHPRALRMSPLPSFATDAVQSTLESPNDRSTVDIIWSCLVVIFSCTWVAIHPNIPPRHIRSSRWKMLRRRIFLMLWAILVPELMVMWAVHQWFDAAEVVRHRAASLNEGDEQQRERVSKGDFR